jgi:ADP-glucose type glycogen/starch synthase
MSSNGNAKSGSPRILIVTPEITYLPAGMGNMANSLTAKAGGLADVSASLVSALFELGADVHVALPHYRRMFNIDVGQFISEELLAYKSKLPRNRIHLAEDRIFYYRDQVYEQGLHDALKLALAFQREVINNIIPLVKPDLIHCNDWMTGLIPAMARRLGIPCLFTVHNIHTHNITLDMIEDNGIDAAEFWNYLYYMNYAGNYEETRHSNPVDLLTSGIFASHYINTVSPTFLNEVADGHHSFVPPQVRHEVTQKVISGCAAGILNAVDPGCDPQNDEYLMCNYGPEDHAEAKRDNKLHLQEQLGLIQDADAPIFFWPSRLDPVQKGCQLLADIFYHVVSKYWDDGLQFVMVANGAYQEHFHNIVRWHDLHNRVAVCDFHERLSHRAYAASDFLLMPSLFEPCGLPQMISSIYGSLPVARNTGGLHDTVTMLDAENNSGNGFLFNDYDSNGLLWAIDRAMDFYHLSPEVKSKQIERIMIESSKQFNHSVTAESYFKIYEEMLHRPLIKKQ